MATDLSDPESAPANTTELLSGILDDLQVLVEKQFQLVRSQIEQDLRQRLMGFLLIGFGCCFLLIAATVSSFAAAHWLSSSLSQNSRTPGLLPVWGAEFVVGVGLFAGACIVIAVGRSKFQRPIENRKENWRVHDDRYGHH